MLTNAERIAALKAEIAKLEEDERLNQSMTPGQRIATLIHTTTCHANHTDGCGWYYEKEPAAWHQQGSTHELYLRKADRIVRKIMEEFPDLTLPQIVRLAVICLSVT